MHIYFIIALRNLLQAKRRTFLLGSALTVVTLLLVMLLALTQGITNTIMRNVTTISTGHINVSGFYKITSTNAAPLINETSKLKALIVNNIPDVDYIIDRHRGWAKVVSDSHNLYALLSGIDINEESRWLEVLQPAAEHEYKAEGSGDIIGDLRKLHQPNSIMLFANQAVRLETEVGDVLTLIAETSGGVANTLDVTVVAIAKDLGLSSNFIIFLPKQVIRSLYHQKENVSGAIHIYLKDIKQSAATMGHLRDLLINEGYRLLDYDPNPFFMKFENVIGEDWQGQKIDLTLWSDEISFLKWIIATMETVSIFFIGIQMVLIAIGIMNTMWISVRERTNEIGTLRAIGMSRTVVLRMFLLETVLLSLFATTVGALTGALLAQGIDSASIDISSTAVRAILMSNTIHLSVQPVQLITSILILSLISTLAALWPALRASRLQPVTAIHYVG